MTIDRARRSGLVLVGVAALAAAGCGDDANAGSAAAEAGDDGFTRVINVEISPVATTSFTEQIRLTGTVQANRDVTVAAEESGRIERILVEKGARVGAGQPILEIDDAILSAQVRQARARAALAQELWQRRRRLWEEDQVGTEQAYLEAKFGAQEAAANLEMLQERRERTAIRAPFEGVLDERLVELGDMVAPGTPVARIVDLDPVKIQAGVPERYAPDVEPGDEVSVSFDVLSGDTHSGEITYVGSTVNPRNRTFGVEFTLPNPGRVIKPEMVANVLVVRQTLDDAVVVPQEALVRTAEGFRAFVVDDASGEPVARARSVAVGSAQRNEVVVEGGLSPGDRLVVVGQQQVADGDRIRIVAERAPSPRATTVPGSEAPADTTGGER